MSETVIDLFAGAGGFGLGFSQAHYELVLSLEKDVWAAQTIKENSDHKVLVSDIRSISSSKKICNVVSDPPDVIIGGPPCQGFSIAGKRILTDPRNVLFRELLRWVSVLNPKIFIIENVPAILKANIHGKGKLIDEIEHALPTSRYQISTWKLNAADYGVPQFRKRAFIVGSLGDLIPPPPENMSSEYVSVWDAISDLPQISSSEGQEIQEYTSPAVNVYQKTMRASSKYVLNHVAMNHTQRIVKRYTELLRGVTIENIDKELLVRKRNGGGTLSKSVYHSNYRILRPELPSHTIPAHFYSSFIHPFTPRNITAREAARIQSFPDHYKFMGKRTMISKSLLEKRGDKRAGNLSQYNQVGNAVPPLLSQAIAHHLRQYL